MSEIKYPERQGAFIQGLYDLIAYIGNTKELTIIEIGSWVGCSAEIFAQNFKHVTSIDPYVNGIDELSQQHNMESVYQVFKSRMAKYNNVTSIRDFSKNVKDISADVVYIDGAHDYDNCKQDIQLYLDRAKLFICGHDYYNKFPGVIKAVNELLGTPEKIFQDKSWIFKKDKLNG